MCDADGLITYYNQQAVSMWGREPKLLDSVDRFCGSFRLFSADGEPLDHSECWMALALRHETAYNGEEIVVERPDGERITVLAHANPIHDESGKLIGALNLLVDIGDRKRGSEAAAQLAAIVESSEDAIVSKDLDGTIKSWNRGAERLFGYSAHEVVGKSITVIIPDNRLDEEDEILGSLRNGQRIEHFETVRQRKDGALVDISLSVSPIVDHAGRIIGASKIARDITEKKQAELALKEQAHTLATINRVAGMLAAELDLQRLVQAITDAGTDLSRADFGAFFYNEMGEDGAHYSLYALSGVPRESFDRFPMPRNTHVFGPTFSGEGTVRSDDITKDSRYGRNPPYNGMPEGHLPVRSYLAVPVVSRSGEVLGGLFFGHSRVGVFDEQAEEIVTGLAGHAATAIDNARLYDKARRLNETLEEKVEQRTADLKALNEELETFNYSVAHDLRGSLRGIDGFSQVIVEECGDALNESGRESIDRVQRAAQHMGEVIDNLLELSKLIRTPIVRAEVDLSGLAQEALERLRSTDSNRRVTCTIEENLTASGDSGLLRVVIDNLLENAWKFTRQRQRAQIEVGSITERDGERVYYVRDNGAGFEMSFADKLFKPFQRLHSPDEYEGTGIGLATVERVIQKHGGRVWAEGEVDKGATFWFSLGTQSQS